MSSDRIATIDVETTGKWPWRGDRIVEIAIVTTNSDGAVLAEYDTLVNPDRDIGPTHIHKINSSDVFGAPEFADIAGDVLETLKGVSVVAGHNARFDLSFLNKEFERMEIEFPEIPTLCTCGLFGRQKLAACCEQLGIPFEGEAHRALSDARATSKLVALLCQEDQSLLDEYRLTDIVWPHLYAMKTKPYRRENAIQVQDQPPRFLQRIASRIRHDVETTTPKLLAYLALIDRMLEDRKIDESEEEVLVDAAVHWGISQAQLDSAHKQYLYNLVVLALADGIVSEGERRDLGVVAKLLGQDKTELDSVVTIASEQLSKVKQRTRPATGNADPNLGGKRICFTGELQSTIDGVPISRSIAESIAEESGMIVDGSVTKKLYVLVVADPNTMSSKAKKARDYGIRILSEAVFFQMVGVTVD